MAIRCAPPRITSAAHTPTTSPQPARTSGKLPPNSRTLPVQAGPRKISAASAIPLTCAIVPMPSTPASAVQAAKALPSPGLRSPFSI